MSQYISVGCPSQNGSLGVLDPLSKNIGMLGAAAGGIYGFMSKPDKGLGRKVLSALLWGLAGSFVPVPVAAYVGYKFYKGEVKI